MEVLKRRRRVEIDASVSQPLALIDRVYIVQTKIVTEISSQKITQRRRGAHIEHGRSSCSQTGHAVDVVAFPHVAACARNARSRHSGEQ